MASGVNQEPECTPILSEVWDLLEEGLVRSLLDPSSQDCLVLFEVFEHFLKLAYANGWDGTEQLVALLHRLIDAFF